MMLRADLKLDLDASATSAPARRTGGGLRDVFTDPVVLGTLLLAAGAAVYGYHLDAGVGSETQAVEDSVSSALREAQRIESDRRRAEDLADTRGTVDRQLDAIRRIDTNRYSFVHLMDQASDAMLSHVWLESITTTQDRLDSGDVGFRIVGFAPDNDTVSRFLESLGRSPFLDGIAFASASALTLGAEDVVHFALDGHTVLPDESFLETSGTLLGGGAAGSPVGTLPIPSDSNPMGFGAFPPSNDDS